jgi:hypothetical protein
MTANFQKTLRELGIIYIGGSDQAKNIQKNGLIKEIKE